MQRRNIGLLAILVIGLWVTTASSRGARNHQEGPERGPATTQTTETANPGPEQPGQKRVDVGPEHKRLLEQIGTWRVEAKTWARPGAEPTLSHGTKVVRSTLDGLAIVAETHTTGSNGEFKGYSFTTWNLTKQRYQNLSMNVYSCNGPEVAWGTFDGNSATWTWLGQHALPDGTIMATRTTDAGGPEQRVVSVYMSGEDGQEFKSAEITYTR